MKRFFEFVGFEYKKMLGRKTPLIVLSLILVFVLQTNVSVFFPWYESTLKWEDMVQQRIFSRKHAGKPMDAEFFETVMWGGVLRRDGIVTNDLWQVWGRIITREAMDEIDGNGSEIYVQDIEGNTIPITIRSMSGPDFAVHFYEIRNRQMAAQIEALHARGFISERGGEQILQRNAEIPEPWIYDYTGGYRRFFDMLHSAGTVITMIAFAIAACVAPIFAREHSTNVAQLILTSKHGKGKIIGAKIFTALSFGLIATVLCIGISYAINMAVFGADGGGAPYQLYSPHSPYPFTMFQSALIFTVYAMLRFVFFTSALVFLSAKIKSSFVVMLIAAVWIILAMTINVNYLRFSWLANLGRLFAAALPLLRTAFHTMPYEIFGAVVYPFIFEPIVAVLASAVLLPLAARAFKRCQL